MILHLFNYTRLYRLRFLQATALAAVGAMFTKNCLLRAVESSNKAASCRVIHS